MRKILFYAILLVLVLTTSAFAYVSSGGVSVESSKLLNRSEMQIKGIFALNNKIAPMPNLKINVLSIPFEWRLGLSKGREFGIELQIDNQKTDYTRYDNITNQLLSYNYNGAALARLNIMSKFKLTNKLSTKLKLGYSKSGKTYYSTDGVYGKADILYDYELAAGTIHTNAGYEFSDGDFSFMDSKNNPSIAKRFTYALGYFYPAGNEYALTIEFTGSQKFNTDFDNLMDISLGLKYMIDYDVVALASVSKGLADGSPEVGFKLGFEKFFGTISPKNEYVDYKWKNKNVDELKKIKSDAVKNNINEEQESVSIETEKIQTQKGKVAEAFTKVCEICGYSGAEDENYCPNEGAKLKTVKPVDKSKCSVCGNKLPENAKFCPYCGAPVSSHEFQTSQQPQTKEAIEKNSPELTEQKNEKVESLLEYAKIAYDERDFEKAIGYYRQASIIDNKNSKIFYNLGVVFYLTRQYPEAKQTLEKAYKLNSKDIDTLLYLGATNGILKNYNESAQFFKKVLEIEPDNKIAKQNLMRMGAL